MYTLLFYVLPTWCLMTIIGNRRLTCC